MQPTREEIEQLRHLEEALWRTESRFDLAFFASCLADDFVEIGRSGRRYDREEILAVPRQEIPAEIPLPAFQVRLLVPDVALVSYESHVAYATGFQRARRSSIWSRSASGWLLRFHQGTPMPAPE